MQRYRDTRINKYHTPKCIRKNILFSRQITTTKANINSPARKGIGLVNIAYRNFRKEKNVIMLVQNDFHRFSLTLKHNGHEKFTLKD